VRDGREVKVHEEQGMWSSLGLLVLRLFAGGMMFFVHGWPKLADFSDLSARFPDPLGLGSSTLSLGLVVFAEAFCALAVMFGFATRLVAVPLLIAMLVAAFVFHADDPWAKKELAVLYAGAFFTLICAGPGKFSVDASSSFRGLKLRE
jgi:putative oxidoreductase